MSSFCTATHILPAKNINVFAIFQDINFYVKLANNFVKFCTNGPRQTERPEQHVGPQHRRFDVAAKPKQRCYEVVCLLGDQKQLIVPAEFIVAQRRASLGPANILIRLHECVG